MPSVTSLGITYYYCVVTNTNENATSTKTATATTRFAQIEVIPAPTTGYAVTVSGSYANPTGAGNYEKNATVTIHAGTRSDYSFTGWTTTSEGVTFANANDATTTFSMPDHEVTVTANWKYNGGGSSGGSSDPSYAVKNETPKAENGSVSLSKTHAEAGETVKLTPKADEGYELDTLTVKDDKGNEIKVTKNEDGTYSFYMPSGKVTVEATFKPIEALWVNPFTDVKEGDWCYDAVKFANQKGLFAGTGAETFSPNAPMTRAMLWTVLGRLDGQSLAGPGVYDAAKAWAMQAGITDGRNPGGSITRAQLITILWRYAGSPKATGDLSAFSDADSVANYAKEAMTWAVEAGIVGGNGGKLLPSGSATRAQVAAIMMRYHESIVK